MSLDHVQAIFSSSIVRIAVSIITSIVRKNEQNTPDHFLHSKRMGEDSSISNRFFTSIHPIPDYPLGFSVSLFDARTVYYHRDEVDLSSSEGIDLDPRLILVLMPMLRHVSIIGINTFGAISSLAKILFESELVIPRFGLFFRNEVIE